MRPLDFYPRAPYSPIVVYGSFRTLINLLLVLALGAIFIWGSFRVFGAFTGSASAPPPTLTPMAVVEHPVAPPTATPTKRAVRGTGARATPTPRPTPRPTPTPNTPPKVFVTLLETDTTGATSFSAKAVPLSGGAPQLWCRVRNSALPTVGSVTFTWQKDVPNASPYQYAVARQAGDFTDGYFQNSGFSVPGNKFRCDIAVNGQSIGSAHFTITP